MRLIWRANAMREVAQTSENGVVLLYIRDRRVLPTWYNLLAQYQRTQELNLLVYNIMFIEGVYKTPSRDLNFEHRGDHFFEVATKSLS